MMVTANAPGPTGEALSLDDVEHRFRSWLREGAAEPLADHLEAYVEALEAAVQKVEEGARQPVGAEGTATGTGPTGTTPATVADGDRHQVVSTARRRAAYYERFLAELGPDIMAEADRRRAAVFAAVTDLADPQLALPGTLEVEVAPSPLPPPESLVRPTWRQRIGLRFSRRETRKVPVLLLARLYAAEVGRRLEPVLNDIARLEALAIESVRQRLHAGGTAVSGDAGPDRSTVPAAPTDRFRAEARQAEGRLATVLEEVGDAFARALRAPAVDVDADDVEDSARQAAEGADRLLEGWRSMEAALQANTRSEAVLSRALAELDVVRVEAALELERVIEAEASAPLRGLAAGLRRLAERAEPEIDEQGLDPLRELRSEAERLFDAEATTFADDLGRALDVTRAAVEERLSKVPDHVPDELLISQDRVERTPPRPRRLELRDAPVEELLGTTCKGVLPRRLERGLADAGEEMEVLQRELVRLRNAVDFHIRAPLRGGFADHHDAAELVVGILGRSADQLDDLRGTARETLLRVVDAFEREVAEESDTIRRAVGEREFMKIRSEIAEEQAVRHLSTGLEWSRRVIDSAIRIGRGGWAFGRRGYTITQDWAQRQLGMGEVERAEMLESLEQSLLDERQTFDLPPLYRQLFDVEGEVPWDELLVSRDEELATLRRAYERAVRGQSATVAIIGEKGSGKTTLVRLAVNQLFADRSVRELELERTVTDPSDLAATLAAGLDVEAEDMAALEGALSDGEPMVVILENAHHLFIRALGGFAVLEEFLHLVASTQRRVFWVVTIDEYAWNYLDRATGLGPHFTHEINTTNIPAGKLEEAIMARHEVSGYALEFETSHAARKRSVADRLTGRRPEGELSLRELQKKAYFRELNQIAEGNIFLALFYWIRSIHRIEDHALVIRDPEMVAVEFLDRLPLPALHSMAAVILHGGLSTEEHQRIFQVTPSESRLQLASLADSHLLFRAPEDGEYKINKVLYRPFIRLLRGKNIF